MRERFLHVYTAALAHILDARGLHDQKLPPAIRPLRSETRLAGPAFTVSGRPAEPDSYDFALRKVLAMLGQVPTGHVAVYPCGQEYEAECRRSRPTSATAPSSAVHSGRRACGDIGALS